jgi:TonB family protein
VTLSVLIGADGSIKASEITEGSGNEKIDEAARNESFKWKMKPGDYNGIPGDMWVLIPVLFKPETSAPK